MFQSCLIQMDIDDMELLYTGAILYIKCMQACQV